MIQFYNGLYFTSSMHFFYNRKKGIICCVPDEYLVAFLNDDDYPSENYVPIDLVSFKEKEEFYEI